MEPALRSFAVPIVGKDRPKSAFERSLRFEWSDFGIRSIAPLHSPAGEKHPAPVCYRASRAAHIVDLRMEPQHLHFHLHRRARHERNSPPLPSNGNAE